MDNYSVENFKEVLLIIFPKNEYIGQKKRFF